MDRQSVPFEIVYHAVLSANYNVDSSAAEKLLRTRNDAAHHLNLPLPSGHLSTFLLHDGVPLLVNESPVSDTALNQEFEIDAGESPDVQVSASVEDVEANLATLKKVPLIPHVIHLRETEVQDLNRIEISNARNSPISMEISVRLDDGETLLRSDVAPVSRNGMPTLRFTVPANQTVAIRYQTGHTSVRPEPDG